MMNTSMESEMQKKVDAREAEKEARMKRDLDIQPGKVIDIVDPEG